jgi:hypothetical protein
MLTDTVHSGDYSVLIVILFISCLVSFLSLLLSIVMCIYIIRLPKNVNTPTEGQEMISDSTISAGKSRRRGSLFL